MCGLAGFFVGCDLKVSCPRINNCQISHNYRSSFKRWDGHASVRSSPSRSNDVNDTLFPDKYVPVLQHSLVGNIDNDKKELLQKASLFRFLNFTHKLEIVVVNTVTANIALGLYDTAFPDELRMDAHRIYVDEAYHALFSFELMKKIKLHDTCGMFEENLPAFICRTQKIIKEQNSENRTILELLAVIVSEMLITDTLREAGNSSGIDKGISLMIKDHARDETRHFSFYKSVLVHIWPRLSKRHKNLVLDHIYPFLEAYLKPDIDAISSELTFIGLSRMQTKQVVSEVYSEEVVSNYVNNCGKRIFSTLESLVDPHDYRRIFENKNIGKKEDY